MKVFCTLGTIVILLLFPSFLFSEQTSLTITILGDTECIDGIDNDSDGLIDFPNDPGCSSFTDDDETDTLPPPPPPPSGGGGGGQLFTRAVITGYASPESKVFLLKDGQRFDEGLALSDGLFRFIVSDVATGNHLFGLYFEDSLSRVSSLFSFYIGLNFNVITYISDILLAPTLDVTSLGDDEQPTSITGFTVPEGIVTLSIVDGVLNATTTEETTTDTKGRYDFLLTDQVFAVGTYKIIVQSTLDTLRSGENILEFIFGLDSKGKVIELRSTVCKAVDYNTDSRVNIIDFSILLYWFERFNPPDEIDLNNDNVVDLSDFSIMAYCWTG